ncbi:endonuclease/exonuclease/phosphatase family protein [Micromonospora soli]|uniref:endonuclease/exonuclease/phosphatase family protein n=1 Tax=Micromonospora sp. NBRC 110009 TaxID=3061627 RepID=UPI0026741FDA|nr:endonuclease/exonuclease/phosphatase family protein [Micromonospora sp. NBRC 110009]WKT96838.1 endonuclease/exonuclease/phosphatase family protein [Micromonospora sp. NBRC 110009]
MANDLIVMTWNVENLFRPDAGDTSAAETYAAKLAYLAGLISGTGADVVALQEIGSPTAAEDLRAALGEPWQALVSSHPDSRGIRVAVLARHALTEEAQIVALPQAGLPAVPDVDGGTLTHLGRGAVQVHVDSGGPGLRLLTAHLKSKLLTYPGGRRYPRSEDERARGAGYALLRRTAEAVALRVHLNDVLAAAAVDGQPGMPTILCGDLNDGPDAVTTVLLEGPADGDVHRPDTGDAVRLYNLGRRLPPARAYSRIYQGRGELIDHILATRDLQLRLVSIDSLVDDITSIGASTRSREGAIVPDHAPVIARFTTP